MTAACAGGNNRFAAAIPGMGGLIVNAAITRDFPVVQGVVFVMVLIVVSINLVSDILYSVLDPRIA